jgi:uncharacterized RDD family membrane protein YckC
MTNGYPPSGGQPPPEGGQPPDGPSDPGPPPSQPPQYPSAPPPGGYPQHPQQQSGYGQPPQAPSPYGGGPSGPRAGFWQRVGAYIIDIIIVSIPLIILFGLLGGFDELGEESAAFSPMTDGENVAYSLIGLVVGMSYFILLEGGASGQTIGKRALSIRVIHQQTGGSIGYTRALGRNAVRTLPSLIPIVSWFWGLLDALWMLWDREKQTLHDKAAGTLVVPVTAYPIRGPSDAQQQAYRPQSYGSGEGPPGGPGPNP